MNWKKIICGIIGHDPENDGTVANGEAISSCKRCHETLIWGINYTLNEH